jgi:hypothetical protein
VSKRFDPPDLLSALLGPSSAPARFPGLRCCCRRCAGGVKLASYQAPYGVTALAHARSAIERMRSGIAMRAFQAAQQASTMAS